MSELTVKGGVSHVCEFLTVDESLLTGYSSVTSQNIEVLTFEIKIIKTNILIFHVFPEVSSILCHSLHLHSARMPTYLSPVLTGSVYLMNQKDI